MPAPTPADVATHLGLPSTDLDDPRLVNATSAGIGWVQARRSRTVALGFDVFNEPAVWQGAVLYAGLVYQTRSTPAGIPGPELFLGGNADTSGAYFRAVDLVGRDPVTA